MADPDSNPVRNLQNRVAAALPGSAVPGQPQGSDGSAATEPAATVLGPTDATSLASPRGSSNSATQGPADPLAQAIADIAAHYGTPSAAAALTSSLPLVNGRLPLEHAADAAARAGLLLEVTRTQPQNLQPSDLPAIVLTRDGDVEILWELRGNAKGKTQTAVMSLPGSSMDKRIEVPARDLKRAAKRILRLRPASGLDARGNEAIARKPKGWFLAAFRDSRRIYAEAIAATLAVNVLALAVPLFSMNVYDRVLPNAAEATLWALALGVGIAILFDFLIRTLRASAVDAASRRADARLSAMIYGRLLGARLATQPASTGVRANTLREFETLREFLNSATLTAFGDLPFMVLFLAVLWVVAGPLVWVVAAAIPVILGVGYITQRALGKLIEEAFRESAQKNAVATETVSGLESIKAAGAESWAALKWERAVAQHIRTGIDIRHVTNLGQHTINALQTLVQVLVVVFGFYLVAAGELTMGALIAATILSGRALQPLTQAAGLISRLNQTRMAYRSLTEIINAPQERAEGATYLSKTDISGNFRFENVAFSYGPMAQPAVKGIDLDIAGGEHVAIIGGIGSGKTTALKMMQGLQAPTSGRVLVDGISVGQIEPVLLRRQVALLLQDACLFHGTIRENITMAEPAISDETLMQAARISGAFAWIARLPLGFDTPIRERGIGLSGGQRQSVALARALASDPKVLLLDEPTSEMDGRSEQNVIAALQSWAKGRTLVIVTHRPALLALAQRLIVLDEGRIAHDGPKDKVLAKLSPVAGEVKTAVRRAAPAQKPATVSLTRGAKPKSEGGGA